MKSLLIIFIFLPTIALARTQCGLSLDELHPTQGAVGFEQVQDGIKDVEKKWKKGKLPERIREKTAPAVFGPDQRWHILDGHHFARELYEANIPQSAKTFCIDEAADFSHLSWPRFVQQMQQQDWFWAFDENDSAIDPMNLPEHVADLPNDPYRTLAWKVREQDGYKKTTTPYAEFLWARFFRSQGIASDDVREALKLAKSRAARHLPGYLGN